MTLWLGLALMTVAAILAVLWPLARRRGMARSGSDVAVYRDQLDEIERDRAAGLIEDKEAAAARIEVSRRLVAAVALVALPLGASAFYLALGSPSLPDQPLASRLAAGRGSQTVDSLVAQVETHLERNP